MSHYPTAGPESSPYAKIIADSISGAGHRLTTFEVRFHRFVLAEFNTHRVFSRNSASSRARPVGKVLDQVFDNLAVPLRWGSEKRGMQAGQEIEELAEAEFVWRRASHHASVAAEDLIDLGVHKSIVNRLLEPFMMHTVIVTGTAWRNFFAQRCSPLAQPEIQAAAEMMREAYDYSRPVELKEGEWHLPYVTEEDWEGMADLVELGESMYPLAKRVSTARCARVSYLTHDGRRDLQEDLDLYERLVSANPMHSSPLEHVATPDNWNVVDYTFARPNALAGEGRRHLVTVPKVGNFVGWRQHRLEVEIERGLGSYA